MDNEVKILKITLKYKNKVYEVYDDCGKDEPREVDYFLWEDGNFACDCNRSDFISRFYEGFEEMNCGDEIKLIKIEKIDNDAYR